MGMLRSGFKTPSTFQNTKSSCQLVIQIILKKVEQLARWPVCLLIFNITFSFQLGNG
jgi:hypothetical protein